MEFSERIIGQYSKHSCAIYNKNKGKPCPWFNEDIKHEMNYHDALNRKAQKTKMKENWEVYKQQKNRINNIIKNAKINYHKNLLEEMQLNRNNFGNY